ncbi:MAG TPA: hypothetical protein VEK76_05330 [Candidatus Binatia bacterium]|nr:hypothetical protein [Candidatus Binatia bacterium]
MPAAVLARDQAEVEETGLRLVSLLGEAGRSRTWLARGPSGEVRVARRLPERPVHLQGVGVSELIRLVSLREPSLLTPTQVLAAGSTWVVRRFSSGTPLRRLLTVAGLSSPQVVAIAHDVGAALAALHSAGLAHGAVHPGNVIIGIDGRARLCDAGILPPADLASASRRDLDDLRSLVREAMARRPRGQRPRDFDGQAQLDAALRRLVDALQPLEMTAATLVADLDRAAGEPGPSARRGLSALVARVDRRAAGVDGI